MHVDGMDSSEEESQMMGVTFSALMSGKLHILLGKLAAVTQSVLAQRGLRTVVLKHNNILQ